MKLRILLFGLIVLVSVAACSPPPVLRDPKFLKDTSIISDGDCKAPCWREITPGVTSWNEALTIIEDSADFANLEKTEPTDAPYKAVEFDAKDGSRCCRVYSTDGKIISSMFTLIAPDVTFGQVIAKYGDPAYFFAEKVTDDQALVSTVYPAIPLIVYVFSAGMTEGVLSESSEVVGVLYLTDQDMQEAIKGSSLYQWTGYGKLADLAQGEYDITPMPTDETSAEVTPEATAQTNN